MIRTNDATQPKTFQTSSELSIEAQCLLDCQWQITATSSITHNKYLDSIHEIAMNFLENNHLKFKQKRSSNYWQFQVESQQTVLMLGGHLALHHTYLHRRQKKVDIIISPVIEDPKLQQHSISIGGEAPIESNLEGCKEVYFKRYLRDHSLPNTRLIHTIATIAFGLFGTGAIVASSVKLENIALLAALPLPIAAIYGCGFLSHLFVEKNIPSASTYPLEAIYSDLRVTFQTTLNWLNKGMDKDLKQAGIYQV